MPLCWCGVSGVPRERVSVARSCDGRSAGMIRLKMRGQVPASGPGSLARSCRIRALLVQFLHLIVRGLCGVGRARLLGVGRARLLLAICVLIADVLLRARAGEATGAPGPVVCAAWADPIGVLRIWIGVCVLPELRPSCDRGGFSLTAPDPARGGEPAPIACPCRRRVGAHTVGCLRGERPAVRSCGRKREQTA